MKTKTSPELITLQDAQLAARAAAMAVWERDGREDRGSCGGCVVLLKGGRRFSKIALENGFAWTTGGDIYLKKDYLNEIASQNADIEQAACAAWREVIKAAGFEDAIKRWWDYID
jgi:hypothetical protein